MCRTKRKIYELNLRGTAVSSSVSLFSLTARNTRLRGEVVEKGLEPAEICWKIINAGITVVYTPWFRLPCESGMSFLS